MIILMQKEKTRFEYEPLDSLPSGYRKYSKGSIYDPVLNEFLESPHKIWKINMGEISSDNMSQNFRNRIKKRGLSSKVEVVVIRKIVYLQKIS
jgi:hypothetical protein